VGQVAHLGADDLGLGRAGQVQELVELVRGQIAQHPAVAVALEEPGADGSWRSAGAAHADHVQHPADGARLDQLAALTVARLSWRSLYRIE
jgi:hypothetical protein